MYYRYEINLKGELFCLKRDVSNETHNHLFLNQFGEWI